MYACPRYVSTIPCILTVIEGSTVTVDVRATNRASQIQEEKKKML
jgi:hypothetical protein